MTSSPPPPSCSARSVGIVPSLATGVTSTLQAGQPLPPKLVAFARILSAEPALDNSTATRALAGPVTLQSELGAVRLMKRLFGTLQATIEGRLEAVVKEGLVSAGGWKGGQMAIWETRTFTVVLLCMMYR